MKRYHQSRANLLLHIVAVSVRADAWDCQSLPDQRTHQEKGT